MKKLNFVVGDPQTCLGVQETFLYIRESPATRGRAYNTIQHERASFSVKSRFSGHAGRMNKKPVVVLRTNVILNIIMLTLLSKTNAPTQQHAQIEKFLKTYTKIKTAKYSLITGKTTDIHTQNTLIQHNTNYLNLKTPLNTLFPPSRFSAPNRTSSSPPFPRQIRKTQHHTPSASTYQTQFIPNQLLKFHPNLPKLDQIHATPQKNPNFANRLRNPDSKKKTADSYPPPTPPKTHNKKAAQDRYNAKHPPSRYNAERLHPRSKRKRNRRLSESEKLSPIQQNDVKCTIPFLRSTNIYAWMVIWQGPR